MVIAGDSASGKSALVAELHKRGWTVLADDLTPLGLDADGRPVVWPASADIRLWPDTVEHLDIQGDTSQEHRIVVAAREDAPDGPVPLRASWRLGVLNVEPIEVDDVTGPSASRC